MMLLIDLELLYTTRQCSSLLIIRNMLVSRGQGLTAAVLSVDNTDVADDEMDNRDLLSSMERPCFSPE